MDYRSELIALVDAFVKASGKSEARVANLASRDGEFFVRLREGKGCTVDTLHHLRSWFSANWPDNTTWPEGIERAPLASSEAA